MRQAELLNVMESFVQSGLHRMEYEAEGARLVLERNAHGAPMAAQQPLAFAQGSSPAMPLTTQDTGAAKDIAQDAPQAPEQTPAQASVQEVKAPLVGVFYTSATPGEASFVKEGDTVERGQVLCLIEAMKMMNELNSPVRGVVRRVLAENEAVVSFGQVLFEVVPC